MKIRYKLSLSIILIMAASCQAGRWQDLGRWLGYGYGDGYHACKTSAVDSEKACHGCEPCISSATVANPFQFPHPTNLAKRQNPQVVTPTPRRVIRPRIAEQTEANPFQFSQQSNAANRQNKQFETPEPRSLVAPELAEEKVVSPKKPIFSRQIQPPMQQAAPKITQPQAKNLINDAWKPQTADLVSTRRLTNVDK